MLDRLEFLNISRNENFDGNLKGFEDLVSLRTFYCWICNLETLPSFAKLTALEDLNIAYNAFRILPDLSTNTSLRLIYANHNQLDTVPDFQSLTNLTKVRLYNNFLNVSELVSLSNFSDAYIEVFPVLPQEILPINIKGSYFEYDSIEMLIDDGFESDSTMFTWYKEDQIIWTGNKDTFQLYELSSLDEGEYHFEITTNEFPDIILRSDTFDLVVGQCINPNGFEVNIVNANCNELGIVSVTSFDQNKSPIVYKIIVNEIENVFTDTIQLNRGNYTITATFEDKCEIDIDNINMNYVECVEGHFSPNNDGFDDSYYFEDEGSVEVFDKFGKLLINFDGPYKWDGLDSSGKTLAAGYYTVSLNKGERIYHITIVY